MSFLLDLFTNNAAQQAANAQEQALAQGLSQYTSQVNAGNQNLLSNYTSALQPYLQNYGQAQQGTTQLGNVLGLNGPAGSSSALSTLQSTPGYQFQLQQGDNATNAAAAANGTLNSGNQQLALSNYNQGLAQNAYNSYVSQLQPYLGYSTSSASGIGNTYTGLGNQLNANNLALGGTELNVAASQGNAQANADLAQNQAAANVLGLLGGVAGLGSGLGGIGSVLGSLFTGATGSLGTGSGVSDLMATYGL